MEFLRLLALVSVLQLVFIVPSGMDYLFTNLSTKLHILYGETCSAVPGGLLQPDVRDPVRLLLLALLRLHRHLQEVERVELHRKQPGEDTPMTDSPVKRETMFRIPAN